jgi:hypothetical protein
MPQKLFADLLHLHDQHRKYLDQQNTVTTEIVINMPLIIQKRQKRKVFSKADSHRAK